MGDDLCLLDLHVFSTLALPNPIMAWDPTQFAQTHSYWAHQHWEPFPFLKGKRNKDKATYTSSDKGISQGQGQGKGWANTIPKHLQIPNSTCVTTSCHPEKIILISGDKVS